MLGRRQHARLAIAQLAVSASELGSANGTCINGERIEAPRLLAPGDIVEIGVYKLVFSVERPAVGARRRAPHQRCALRPIELAAWTGPHELAIVLPELDAGPPTYAE